MASLSRAITAKVTITVPTVAPHPTLRLHSISKATMTQTNSTVLRNSSLDMASSMASLVLLVGRSRETVDWARH